MIDVHHSVSFTCLSRSRSNLSLGESKAHINIALDKEIAVCSYDFLLVIEALSVGPDSSCQYHYMNVVCMYVCICIWIPISTTTE